MPGASSAQDTCVETCPKDYVGSVTERKCYFLAYSLQLGCWNKMYSSDNKRCGTACPINEVAKYANGLTYCIA